MIAQVEWHPGGLCHSVGFIVTNLNRAANRVVVLLKQGGTAEQYINDGKNAVKWTRLSCQTMTANAVPLQLHVLVYNLSSFSRTSTMSAEMKCR